MAQRVNNNTANLSSATAFDSMSSSIALHATTNITVTGTIYSAAFTAPALINFSTGFGVFIATVGTAGTMTFTLQEYNGAAWVDTTATAAIGVTSVVSNAFLNLRWGIAYQYTTLTAGRYRIKCVMTGAAGTTRFAADAAGTAFGYYASDDRTGAIATTDDLFIVGDGTTSRTITVDGTAGQCGNATSTALVTSRYIGGAVTIGIGGKLAFVDGANSTLTAKGSIIIAGGELEMGSVATPIARAYTATLSIDENGTGGNFGIYVAPNSLSKFTGQGYARTSWMGTYKSGVGTAADPLITNAAIDLAIGDEISVAPTGTGNYAQAETRYVITVNSSTSYVVSSAAGGAETALTYSHANGADIFSVTKNIVVKTTNTAHGLYLVDENTTSGNVNLDWVRFENVGSATTSRNGIYLTANNSGVYSNVDNCVAYNVIYQGFILNSNPGNKNYSNLIAGFNKTNSTSNAYCIYFTTSVKTLQINNFIAYDFGRSGMNIAGPAHTITGSLKAIACSQQNASGFGILLGSQKVNAVGIDIYSNRGYGLGISSVTASRFNNAQIGVKGSNDAGDIYTGTDTYNECVFLDSNFGSSIFVVNYLLQVSGSKVKFHRKNGVAMAHFIYTAEGINQATGTGLADTNVRTADSYGFRLAPEDTTTGCSYSFEVLAKADSGVSIFGFAQMNAAFSGDASASMVVNLYLPGSLTPNATTTLTKTTIWQVWSVTGYYTGTKNEFATVEVVVKSTTSAAYAYLDDLYNGTNKIIAFDTWSDGEPSPVMFEQLGDAYAVWAAQTSLLTTPGTTGYKLTNVEDSVWDEPNSSHINSGSTGEKLSDGLTTGQYLGM